MFLAEIGAALGLKADDLAALEKLLTDNSQELGGSPYQHLRLSSNAFGGSDKAASLGFHHLRAHEVVSDTLKQMVKELTDFAEGVQAAAKGIENADDTAAAELTKKADAVKNGDNTAYHRARNQQTTSQQPPTTDGASTGGQG